MAAASNPVIDLDHYVELWAKKSFRAKATRKERKLLEKEQLHIKVDWGRVRFDPDPAPIYTPAPPEAGSAPDPRRSTLYETSYTNRTTNPQLYCLRTERTTSSSCEVTVEHAFTKSQECGIKLATPNSIFEANVGFSKSLSVTNASGDVLQEQVTWSVDTQLSVPSMNRATATVKVEEEDYHGNFRFSTRINGKVKVNYYNLKDNNSYIKSREHSIYEIVREAISDSLLRVSPDGLYCDEKLKAVVCVTRGVCNFRYAVRQRVEVSEEPL